MPGEDEYIPFPSICKCCGANAENGYKHDPNCLFNLPSHTKDLRKWWHTGHEAKLSGAKPGIYMKLDSPEDKAYMMGYRCPQRQLATA